MPRDEFLGEGGKFATGDATSRPVRAGGVIDWSASWVAAVKDAIGDGRPLLLVGRNSDSAGLAGCRKAVDDLFGAAKELRRLVGVDVASALPPPEVLARCLLESGNIERSEDERGQEFINRFMVINMSAEGLVVTLSAGSGAKVTADGDQPHASHIARLLRQYRAAGLFAKRFDRLVRDEWAVGTIVRALAWLESELGSVWACVGDKGEMPTHEAQALLWFIAAQQGANEAKIIRDKRRKRMPEKTDTVMVNGRLRMGIQGAAPAGLVAFKDLTSNGLVWAIDEEASFPDPEHVTSALPLTFDAHGQRLFSADAVRWFLRNYGLEGVTSAQIVAEMTGRKFSTDGLRRRAEHGPAGYFGDAAHSHVTTALMMSNLVEMIKANLDMYETGILRRKYDSGDEDFVEIRGIFPACGQWATPEDFARVRSRVALGQSVRASWKPQGGFHGLQVLLDGVPARLNRNADARGGPQLALTVDLDSRDIWSSDAKTRFEVSAREVLVTYPSAYVPRRPPPVPEGFLISAVLDSLARVEGGAIFDPFVPTLQSSLELDQAVARLEALDRELAHLVRQKSAQFDAWSDLPRADRQTSRLAADLEDQYERTAQRCDAVAAEQAVVAMQVQRLSETAEASVGLTEDDVERLARGLLQSASQDRVDGLAGLLARGLHDIQFKTTAFTEIGEGEIGLILELSAVLAIRSTSGTVAVPVTGALRTGSAALVHERAVGAINQMRHGVIDARQRCPSFKEPRSKMAALLGVPVQWPYFTCEDPDLLRLVMATLAPRPVDGEEYLHVPGTEELLIDRELQEAFGDIPALVERLSSLHLRSRWKQNVSSADAEVAALLWAAQVAGEIELATPDEVLARVPRGRPTENQHRRHQWRLTDDGYRLRPCSHCGGSLLAPLRIAEPRGYVCLGPDCRRDGSGVRWGAQFDRLVLSREMYVRAGVDLDLRSIGLPEEVSEGPRRAGRPAREFSSAELQSIRAKFEDPSVQVIDLLREYSISRERLYTWVREQNWRSRTDTIGRARRA